MTTGCALKHRCKVMTLIVKCVSMVCQMPTVCTTVRINNNNRPPNHILEPKPFVA